MKPSRINLSCLVLMALAFAPARAMRQAVPEIPDSVASGVDVPSQEQSASRVLKSGANTTSDRAIFAYGLHSEGHNDNSVTFYFTPNTIPTSAVLNFTDYATGNAVGSYTISNLSGMAADTEFAITLSQSDLPGSENDLLNWSVTLEAGAVESVVKLAGKYETGWTRTCIAVDNSPESDYFGNFYVSAWVARGDANNGIWAYKPDWSSINTSVMKGGRTTITNNMRIGTDFLGTVYLTDWGDATGGIFIVDPFNFNHTFDSFFGGTKSSSSPYTYKTGTTTIGGPLVSAAAAPLATADNCKLYTMQDYNTGKIVVYNVGGSNWKVTRSWAKAPSSTIDVSSKITSQNAQVIPDETGGAWVSQYILNNSNTSAKPAFIYVDASGTITYNSNSIQSTLPGTAGGGMAVSPDRKKLAIADNSGYICLYDITWSGTTPALTFDRKFECGVRSTSGSTTSIYSNVPNGIYQMAFDWGGNLYVGGAQVGIYSIPKSENRSTVPAKRHMMIKKHAAKSAANLRVYLNPGHGSWGPNDRPQATIPYPMNISYTYYNGSSNVTVSRPDTCGFYETNTNLWKVFGLYDALRNMGVSTNNITLSRWENGPNPTTRYDQTAYNKPTTVIAAEAEAGNYDLFISIHSNAAGNYDQTTGEFVSEAETSNWGMIMFRGTHEWESVPGSKAICAAVWPRHWLTTDISPVTKYAQDEPYIVGDWDWYHYADYSNGGGLDETTNSESNLPNRGYLGALKHSVPGFLIEGYCHTYEPARHRALNSDYCRQEGVRIARGIGDYFGLTPETTGYIMGTVKDKSQSVSNSLYTYASGTVDAYYPVMGAVVQLYDSNGDLVDTYTTDQNYNGVFVFSNVTPGEYTLVTTASGYAVKRDAVIVTANETSYPLVYLTTGAATAKGIYAYGLNSTRNADGSYTFSFTPNADATVAKLVFYDSTTGSEVGTVNVPNVFEGNQRTITLAKNDIPGSGTLRWGVRLTGLPITDEATKLTTFSYDRAGVVVDNSPESDYFGRFYAFNHKGTSDTDNGLWVYNQDWTCQNSTRYNGGETFGNVFRLGIDACGTVYIADWNDAHSGIYLMNPSNPSGSYTQFFQGTRESNGLFKNGGVSVGGSTISATTTGEGTDTKLYVFDEDISDRNIMVYNIGQSDGTISGTWGSEPSRTISTSSVNLNANCQLWPDDRGGVWVASTRWTSATGYPSLIYIDNNDNIVLNVTGISIYGSIAVSHDNKFLAIADNEKTVKVYSITWNGNTPSLTLSHSITTSDIGSYTYQLAFDWGGNIYVAGAGIAIYSLRTADNTTTVPAKAALLVVKDSYSGLTLSEMVDAGNAVGAGDAVELQDDYLIVAYVSDDGTTLYAKDNGNYNYGEYATASSEQIDLVRTKLTNREADQSNWVAINLPHALTTGDPDYYAHSISGVKGRVVDVLNPEIDADVMPEVVGVANYEPNTYVPCNFLSGNWGGSTYYFVEPKPMEYATVTWAVWSSSDNAFVLPQSTTGGSTVSLNGGFGVNLAMLDGYNAQSEPDDVYDNGKAYRFEAIIKRNATASGARRKANSDELTPMPGAQVSDLYTVFPLTNRQDDVITGIDFLNVLDTQRTARATRYFLPDGKELSKAPENGVFIEVTIFSDGTTTSRKMLR